MRRGEAHTLLVRACRTYLRVRGHMAWICPTGLATYGKNRVPYGVPGTPDVHGILRPSGRFIGVECKTGNAVMTRLQEIARDEITDAGGLYVEARTIDDVHDALIELQTSHPD